MEAGMMGKPPQGKIEFITKQSNPEVAMSYHPPTLSQWVEEVSTHLPHLSKRQAMVLALYSYATVVLRNCGMTQISTFLGGVLGKKANTVRQQLRESVYEAEAKQGTQRQAVDVTLCFAPLLRWILSWWHGSDHQLAFALDATNLGQRFTVLCLSVVYRSCALPVAWVVLPATRKGKWMPHLERLLRQLRGVVPDTWRVIVLTDRGLYSPTLYRALQRNHWHPVMRINRTGNFRPVGSNYFRSLADLLPQPNTLWYGRVTCFSTDTLHLDCTLLAYWQGGCDEPWLLVTDLPPAHADPLWYGMRMWIEHGFKDDKRGGFRWEQTKMTDPTRATRLWLVLALAHLWTVSLADEAQPSLALPLAPPRTRALSCLNQGWLRILIAIVTHQPLPRGRFCPLPWPALPFSRSILDLLMPGAHYVPLKTYP
jgi:hypothetical protein